MRKGICAFVTFAIAISLLVSSAPADAAGSEPVVHFVVDVSGSMSGQKLTEAVDAIKATATAIPDSTALGLRSYAGSCDQSGVAPLVEIGLGNDSEIIAAADGLVAGGGTPTTSALDEGIDDLLSYTTTGSRRLVLLTDGDTQCGISVCDFVNQRDLNGVEITLYTVGLQVSASAAADLTCAAEATGGSYIEAADPSDLADALSQAVGLGGPLDLNSWKPGDVHVHASGDSSLLVNKMCRDNGIVDGGVSAEDEAQQSSDCAEFVVDKVASAATEAGLEWVVLSEHGPWLGLKSYDPPGGYPRYFKDFGESSWNLIKSFADSESVDSGVRMLMGEELGTFGTSGHFNSYYSESGYIENTAFDRDESVFLEKLSNANAWGGINHPTSGSFWHCYSSRDCKDGGAVDYPSNVRAFEVFTGDETVKQETLIRWEQLLRFGMRIGIVGGSDVHTDPRTGHDSRAGSQGTSNLDQIGVDGRARTYVFAPGLGGPIDGYNSNDGSDPVRDALYHGRTIASDGPSLAVAVDGAPPSDELLSGTSFDLEFRWPTDDQFEVNSLRFVLGEVVGDCKSKRCDKKNECAFDGCAVWRELPDVDASTGQYAVTIDPVDLYSRDLGDGCRLAPTTFLRVEARFTKVDDSREYSAYSSPFYLPEILSGSGSTTCVGGF